MPPTVIYPLTLPAILHHVLATQSSTCPTTLIICSSKGAFLQRFVESLELTESPDREKLLQLARPTLHNLFTAQHVKIAFCASVQALLAYLTAQNGPAVEQASPGQGEANERIVLVNPLGLHAATPSFSAQGLSRTFAVAVETALRVQAVLLVAESQGGTLQPSDENEQDEEAGTTEPHAVAEDPWEQEVSILNVSARKFGSRQDDRAWAGRTVKINRIAARWFRFRKMHDLET